MVSGRNYSFCDTVRIVVNEQPAGKPAPRARAIGKRAVVYQPHGSGKNGGAPLRLRKAIMKSARELFVRIESPCVVNIEARVARPKCHFNASGKLGKDGESKPWPGKPDVDNVAKLVLDALVDAGLLSDDSIVQSLSVKKMYVTTGGGVTCSIRIINKRCER